MFKIGYRTIKTALGTGISISIAQFLDLENFVSAGILTILCIQVTKKKSLQSSGHRFLACILGIIFSFVFFEGIGYYPLSVGLLLLLFIPTAVMLKIKEGIITSTVIILHFYDAESFDLDLIINELGIIIIGIGVALMMNMYMPSVENQLKTYQTAIEENLSAIFKEVVMYLRTNDSSWGGKEITETADLIQKAKSLAFRDVENHFLRNENHYYHYFQMRENQFEIIEQVLPIVTSITQTVEQGKMIADFMEELSESVHPGNTADKFLIKLSEMKVIFQEMPLPKTREEFEARAALLHFLREMEQYLIIKSSFNGIE